MGDAVTFILIGGSGFLGRNFATFLLNKGHHVVIVGRSESYEPIAQERYLVSGSEAFSELKSLQAMVVIVDFAYTSIPMTSFDDPIRDFSSNLLRTIQYLDFAAGLNLQRYVYVSSGGTVYGDVVESPIHESAANFPISPYGITKMACERYVHLYNKTHGLRTLIVRPSNIFGPLQMPYRGQGFIATALSHVQEGGQISVFGDGSAIRDYLFVDDFCRALYAVVTDGGNGEIYNIGSSIGYSINEVIETINRVVAVEDKALTTTFLPSRPYDVRQNVLDTTKLSSLSAHWKPEFSLADGIKQTWEWMKAGGKSPR